MASAERGPLQGRHQTSDIAAEHHGHRLYVCVLGGYALCVLGVCCLVLTQGVAAMQ
jgi:hypothetical protein